MISRPKKIIEKPVTLKQVKNVVVSESEHTVTEQVSSSESDEEVHARTE